MTESITPRLLPMKANAGPSLTSGHHAETDVYPVNLAAGAETTDPFARNCGCKHACDNVNNLRVEQCFQIHLNKANH